MKRIFLLLILLLVLAACGGDSEEPSVEEQPQVQATQPAVAEEVAAEPTLPPPVVQAESGETAVESAPPEPTPLPSGPITPWSTEDFGYGVQIHGNATIGDPVQTMEAVSNQLGLDWIKVQVQWWLVEPDPGEEQWFFYDSVVEQAYAHNLHLMLSVVGAPAWTRADGTENGPPDDYQTYANFLERLLTRYDGQVHAIEVWNEQNLDREWTTANGIRPTDYVEFLRVAYETIKAHDPGIIVISGALSPTGPGDWVRWADDFEYLDQALAAGMLNYADCVGAHHNGYNVPPNVLVEDTNTLPEAQTAVFRGPFDNQYTGDQVNHLWTFKSTIDGYIQRIQAVDPNKKLCVTEFGWASSEGYSEIPPGFEFTQDNTLQEQADYIVQAYQQMYNSNAVWLTFLFNFDFGNKGHGPTDDPVPYSIVDTNGVPRPAYGAVADMEKPR
jgi:hypothetical protein